MMRQDLTLSAKTILRSESGLAMLMAMVVVVIIGILTVAIGNLALSEYVTAVTNEHSIQAFFVADGGLERALAVLQTDEDWSDGVGVDRWANDSSWQPLEDPFNADPPPGDGRAIDRGFPAGVGIGTYSVYIQRVSPTPPGGGLGGCGPSGTADAINNAWIRVVGRVGRATRGVQFLAHRLTAGEFVTYSAQDFIVDQGGGNVTIHGSLYARQDLGLKAVRTGVYNDRPLYSCDQPPYPNRLFVRGMLDMSTGNPTVGTSLQPMRGVHATRLNLRNDGRQNLWTYELNNRVPDIPYPAVAEQMSTWRNTGYYANVLCRSPLTGVASTDCAPAALGADARIAICADVGGNPTLMLQPNLELLGTRFYLPTMEYWSRSGETCRFGPDPANDLSDVRNPANHALRWEPSGSSAGVLTFFPNPGAYADPDLKDKPIFVPGRLLIGRDVTYYGHGTFAVDYPTGDCAADPAACAVDSGSQAQGGPCPSGVSCQILASRKASQGIMYDNGGARSCPPSGTTTMPSQDLAVFIVNGSVRLSGSSNVCEQENNAIIVAGDTASSPAHIFLSLRKVQMFGIVIANQLDTRQNPDFWQVADVALYMPLPLAQLLATSGGAVVYQSWRELF